MTPEALLARGVPLIDLRAPEEFAKGAFPAAVNLPLLMDAERREVGALYKRQGREAAIRRGQALVSGATRRTRVAAWADFIREREAAWLYCWRGGLRSRIAQAWLREAGCAAPRVEGGFKRLRGACLAALQKAPMEAKEWLILGGRTGTGKTALLEQLGHAIDLEGLAWHRGSAFGARPGGQPPPIAFENALATAYLRHEGSVLVLEDEARSIGRLALPGTWFERMNRAPLVLLQAPLESRIDRIRQEYVDRPLADGAAPQALRRQLADALDRIRKRLGGARHRQVGEALRAAFRTGAHERWIALLLAWYYDPMYDYQLKAKQARIVFRGERAAVAGFLAARSPEQASGSRAV